MKTTDTQPRPRMHPAVRTRSFIWAALCALMLLSGCASVGVRKVAFDERIPEPERLALSVTEPGAQAQAVLRSRGLATAWASKPDTVLRNLDDVYATTRDPQVLYALAELTYLRARDKLDTAAAPPLLLSCVVYSYQYLAGLPPTQPGLPAEQTARNAIAYYNYTLGRYMMLASRAKLRYTQGLRLPVLQGYVELDKRAYELIWQPEQLDEYKVAYEYQAEGMEVYHVTQGLGVPMIAIRRPPAKEPLLPAERYLPQNELTYAATVVIRLDAPLTVAADGQHVWKAEMDVYDPARTTTVALGARQVPLATDLTTPLAYMIEHAPTQGGFYGMLNPSSYERQQGLYMLQPYQPDKIPVVFVHGLMSSPRTWLQMLNDIMGDPVLRRHYQFWFFWYPTGNPVLYSAANLRASLNGVRQQYDPAGTNQAFNRMVVVSHSMGGLLSKTLVQTSGTQLWQLVADASPTQMGFTDEERALVEKTFFFEAQPYIARVMFLATPHRGASMADRPIARLGSYVTSLPDALSTPGDAVVEKLAERRVQAPSAAAIRLDKINTGLDSLSPENAALAALCQLPICVPYHSIIGNDRQAGVPGGTDGIVPYTSSHLEGAQSELIVKSGHSVQENLSAIREVRRLLLQHLQDAAPHQ